ncbi:MAG: AAA family ATPase [Wenzhouxiangellaceae bacterium]|nr:AAA family ATPase [Wenzhouxiangellaceae bacterium]
MMLPQLPLSLTPPRQPRFENFVVGRNQAAVVTLRQGLLEGQWYLLSGPEGCGKSHLALAALAEWAAQGRQLRYVPCRDARVIDLLAHCESEQVIVDDIDVLAASIEGERALFNAMNAWRAGKATVLLTTSARSAFVLPDLASRVGQAAKLVLKPLDDAGLEQLISYLIHDFQLVPGRGLKDYLLRHGPRNGDRLTGLFELMSRRALAERRVVSVPLARECLEQSRAID